MHNFAVFRTGTYSHYSYRRLRRLVQSVSDCTQHYHPFPASGSSDNTSPLGIVEKSDKAGIHLCPKQ
jgi:hypothetical protein